MKKHYKVFYLRRNFIKEALMYGYLDIILKNVSKLGRVLRFQEVN